MSAFVVDSDHVDLLASAINLWKVRVYREVSAVTREIISDDYLNDPQAIGHALMVENVRSVAYRYGAGATTVDEDSLTVDELGADVVYHYHAVKPSQIIPLHVLKACHCYEYQSCEHPGWESSNAAAITEALAHRATALLPGYDGAPWAWSRREAADWTRAHPETPHVPHDGHHFPPSLPTTNRSQS